jgi:hypothetical protein
MFEVIMTSKLAGFRNFCGKNKTVTVTGFAYNSCSALNC